MSKNLFNAIRLHIDGKGLNNELKTLQAKANELNKRAFINATGQIQLPLNEMRSVVSNSASTKNVGYEVTEKATIFDRCKYLQGLTSNITHQTLNLNPSHGVEVRCR